MRGSRRALVLGAALLLAPALAGCTQPANDRGGTDSGPIALEADEWKITPDEVTVTQGANVSIVYRNVGSNQHNLHVGGYGIQTRTIPPGEEVNVTFVADEVGTFHYWCNVTGHREAGMEGTLTVEP